MKKIQAVWPDCFWRSWRHRRKNEMQNTTMTGDFPAKAG